MVVSTGHTMASGHNYEFTRLSFLGRGLSQFACSSLPVYFNVRPLSPAIPAMLSFFSFFQKSLCFGAVVFGMKWCLARSTYVLPPRFAPRPRVHR